MEDDRTVEAGGRSRITRWVLIGAAAVLLANIAYRVPDLALDHDEVQHLHIAWLVSAGDTPFVDYFEHHNHLFSYLLAPFIPDHDTPSLAVFQSRALMLLLSVITAIAGTFLAAQWVPLRFAMAVPVLLFGSMYWSTYAFSVRPDVPMNALSMTALFLAVQGLRLRRTIPFLATGACLATATALLMKAVVSAAVVGAALLVLALFHRGDRRIHFGQFLAFGAGFAAVGALFVLWTMNLGLWDSFVFWVVTFNRAYLMDNPVDRGFGIVPVIGASMTWDPLLWAGLALGGVSLALRWKRIHSLAILVAIAAAVFFFTAGSRQPNYQYLWPAITLFPVIGAVGAGVLVPDLRVRLGSVFRPVAILLVIGIAALCLRGGLALGGLPDNIDQIDRMERVLRLVPPEKEVLASPPHHPIFRRDAVYLWCNNPGMYTVLERLDPPPPFDRHGSDGQELVRDPPAVIVTKGARYHSDYGVGTLAEQRYRPHPADPAILLRVR